MSDQEEYKNGHGREPDKKKPDIGHDDVEDLIDFGDSDEEEIEEEPEELPVSDGMQVVLEASQLLPQDDNDNSDEIEEVPGDLPEVLYEFDPENQEDPESLEEQVVVEQQVSDMAGVFIEMVEERSENELLEEGQVQVEISCDEAEQESPPQSLMGLGNPSNQGLEDPAESSEPSSAALENERLVPSASDSRETYQDGNPEGHGSNDQGLDGESSGHGSNNQDGNNGSTLGQGGNVQDMNDGPSRSSHGLMEEPSESGQCSSNQVQNGRPSISDQGMNNEARNSEPSRSSQSPSVDRNLNGISVQGLKEGPSASGQDLVDQDTGETDQGALVQNLNKQSRSSHEFNAESACIAKVSINEILNGGPSRSDKDPIEQIREDVGACVCEEVMQLELVEDEVEVNVEAHPIQDIGIERQPDLEQDIWLRDRIVEVADAAENVDLNGGPYSGPDREYSG